MFLDLGDYDMVTFLEVIINPLSSSHESFQFHGEEIWCIQHIVFKYWIDSFQVFKRFACKKWPKALCNA